MCLPPSQSTLESSTNKNGKDSKGHDCELFCLKKLKKVISIPVQSKLTEELESSIFYLLVTLK